MKDTSMTSPDAPRPEDDAPSYHDLFITTATIPRTSIFNLGYGLEVTCTRTRGWTLWDHSGRPTGDPRLLAGEYEEPDRWLVLDVAGYVIVDGRKSGDEEADPDAETPGGWNGLVIDGVPQEGATR